MPRVIDMAIRLPESKRWLKPLLARMAEESGMSLNLLLCSVLETWALSQKHKKTLRKPQAAKNE